MGIWEENSLAELHGASQISGMWTWENALKFGTQNMWLTHRNLRNTNGKIRIGNSVDSSNNMFKHSQFQLARKYMFPNIPKWSFPYPVKWQLGSHISHHPPEPRGRRSNKPRKRITTLERVMSVPVIAQSKGGGGGTVAKAASVYNTPRWTPRPWTRPINFERRCWWCLEALEPRDRMKNVCFNWWELKAITFKLKWFKLVFIPKSPSVFLHLQRVN